MRSELLVQRLRMLLVQAREYVHGCTTESGEHCTCTECQLAETLLNAIDSAVYGRPITEREIE